MANLKSLPPFAGRCHVQLLPGTAAHAADTAHMLRLMQPPTTPLAACPTGITARTGDRALWVLLLLMLALAGCKAMRPAHSQERAAPSKNAFTASPFGRTATTWSYE